MVHVFIKQFPRIQRPRLILVRHAIDDTHYSDVGVLINVSKIFISYLI